MEMWETLDAQSALAEKFAASNQSGTKDWTVASHGFNALEHLLTVPGMPEEVALEGKVALGNLSIILGALKPPTFDRQEGDALSLALSNSLPFMPDWPEEVIRASVTRWVEATKSIKPVAGQSGGVRVLATERVKADYVIRAFFPDGTTKRTRPAASGVARERVLNEACNALGWTKKADPEARKQAEAVVTAILDASGPAGEAFVGPVKVVAERLAG